MKILAFTQKDPEGDEDLVHRHLFNFRRLWKLSILLMAGFVLAPLGFMAVIEYQFHQKTIDQEINYQMVRLVGNTRRNVAFFLSERKSALNFIDRDNSAEALSDPARLSDLLEHLTGAFGGFTDMGVIDAQGIQGTYVGPYELEGKSYKDQSWFKELVTSGAHVSEVFLGFRRQPHLVISVKHELTGGSFYVLRASIDTAKFNDLIAEVDANGEGDVFLISRSGQLQSPSRHFGSTLTPFPLEIPPETQRTVVYDAMLKGEEMVIGYTYLEETPFVLMAVKPRKELMKVWHDTRVTLVGFLGLSVLSILAVIVGVSTYLVNKIHEADARRLMTLHQMEYANKMASLGRLSAGVAHEINNPLAIINEKAGLIKDMFQVKQLYQHDERLLRAVDVVISSVERCAKITRRLMNFARHIDVKAERLQVADAIDDVLGFLGKEAEYRSITIEVTAAGDCPPIESDRGKLQEIFLNLFNNAIAAMQEGGKLKIAIDRADDSFVSVKVADTGCGIPEGDLKRIFEPFFSTRLNQGGTGLGLSITYGLIRELGGDIVVESKVGVGTTFAVRLPLVMNPNSRGSHEKHSGG